MTRPKLKIGDTAVVRSLYRDVPGFKDKVAYGDKGTVEKVNGDLVHLNIEGEIKRTSIYNLKKFRLYRRKQK